MLTSLRQNPYYRLFIWVAAFTCVGLVLWIGMDAVTGPEWMVTDDYAEYWTAGQLNLTGGNPYDPHQMLVLQRNLGARQQEPVMMWNPPWMLALAMPLSLISYPLSRVLWLLFSFLVVFVCINRLWSLYGGPQQARWIGWIAGLAFAPFLDGLRIGQSSVLILVGVVGFLHAIHHRRPWLAGAFLSFLAVKPQVLYLFAIAALFWSVNNRQWPVLVGAVIALALATIIAWVANPGVFGQYQQAIRNYSPLIWATPTLGGLFRLLFGTQKIWLQYVPPAIGFLWFLDHWRRQRKRWDWLDQAPLLILVSSVTMAYGWTWDLTAAIVPIIQITVWIMMPGWDMEKVIIAAGYAIVNSVDLFVSGLQFWMWWLPPVLLIWYLAAIRIMRKRSLRSLHEPAI